MSTASLMREFVRQYVRHQRAHADCNKGASTVQCHVLTELWNEDCLTQQTLAKRLGLDKGWISRAVDALVADGAIARRRSDADARNFLLSLTPQGRDRASRLEQNVTAHASGLLAHIPAAQHRKLNETFQQLLGALAHETRAAPALDIRAASPDDWPAISALLTAAGLPLDGARDHLQHFLVGTVKGDVVAVGGLEVYGKFALLRSMAVASSLRSGGYGAQLLAHLAANGRKLGISHLYLLTTTASKYFGRFGFAGLANEAVPDAIRRSREFNGACPASATPMVLGLQDVPFTA